MKNKIMLLILLLVSARGANAFVSMIDSPLINNNLNSLNLSTNGRGVYSLIGQYYDGTYTNSDSGFVAQFDSTGNLINISTTYLYEFFDGVKTPGGFATIALFTNASSDDSSQIVMLDASGNCQSVRSLTDGTFYYGSLCTTPDNGLVAGVDYYGINNDEIFVERSDASGNCVWAKSYNFDVGIDRIAPASDGGYFIAGGLNGLPFVMKVDSSGNKLWDWEDPGYGEFFNMLGAENGAGIAVGYSFTDSSMTNENALAIKIDQSGKPVWRKEMDWGPKDYAMSIYPAAGERLGYILSGASNGFFVSGYLSLFALQIDGNGNTSNLESISPPNGIADVHYGFNAPISANHFILAGNDDFGVLVIADYNPVVYTSTPVAGGAASDNFYVCPQPAQNVVKFVYGLQSRATVKINIYNFANRLVGQSVTTELPADNVTTQVDTTKLKSGVYFYQIIENSGGKEKRLKSGEFIIKK